MYIFVDEAGSFQIPSRPNQVSCVAALVVPEGLLRTLLRRFHRAIVPWKTGTRSEVKGSQLSATQMAAIVKTLRRFDVLLVSVAIDMGLHSEVGILGHKDAQVASIRAGISRTTNVLARDRLTRFAESFSRLPNQLYVQSVLLTKLVENVLNAATLYYSQRIPRTLGTFSWRLDAKDLAVTGYEQLWTEIVGPFLQTRSLAAPLPQLVGADYSAFQRFLGEEASAPVHLRGGVDHPDAPFGYVDIDLFLRDLKFCRSHRSIGIQAVDMLASGIRRACNASLEHKGWRGLGGLMPAPVRGSECVQFIALEDLPNHDVPYAEVLRSWRRDTKRMII